MTEPTIPVQDGKPRKIGRPKEFDYDLHVKITAEMEEAIQARMDEEDILWSDAARLVLEDGIKYRRAKP